MSIFPQIRAQAARKSWTFDGRLFIIELLPAPPAVTMRNRGHRYKNRYRHKGAYREHRPESAVPHGSPEPPGSAPSASYLKSLVDSRATVVVVLTTGERLSGRIRYYDRDCFSLGPAGGGPKLFLRKSSVSYIAEAEM